MYQGRAQDVGELVERAALAVRPAQDPERADLLVEGRLAQLELLARLLQDRRRVTSLLSKACKHADTASEGRRAARRVASSAHVQAARRAHTACKDTQGVTKAAAVLRKCAVLRFRSEPKAKWEPLSSRVLH